MPRQCASIKNKKDSHLRCPNQAKPSQEYCGTHAKNSVKWKNPLEIDLTSDKVIASGKKILKWWKNLQPLRSIHFHGPAYFSREICVNTEDFFNSDSVKDISGSQFFSYRDISDGLVYGFDIRSFNMLIEKSIEKHETPKNPYTRSTIPSRSLNSSKNLVQWLVTRKLDVRWFPTVPITSEQAWRMKIVEIFVIMEELQYGADPEWFITLSIGKQKEFYMHLLDIWSHRAGLSTVDRSRIVPGVENLFHWGPNRISAINLISSIRNINISIMKRLVLSAVDRSDRILGSMYILTALTQVSAQAADAFPWLYETAADFAYGGGSGGGVSGSGSGSGSGWVAAVLNSMIQQM